MLVVLMVPKKIQVSFCGAPILIVNVRIKTRKSRTEYLSPLSKYIVTNS